MNDMFVLLSMHDEVESNTFEFEMTFYSSGN